MEIIIGRESGTRRLQCKVDGKGVFFVGQAGSVPNSVSREHCKLVVNGDSIKISNIKDLNVTYVDGNQILSKDISATSNVQLGREMFTIPLQQIIQLATGKSSNVGAGGKQAPTFSLLPLKNIWEDYDKRKMEIQEEAAKKANQQRIQGIVSMFGMALGLLPIPVVFRAVCVLAALFLAIYFFMSGRNADSVQRQIHDLDEEFAKKYKCPNPECGKPFGSVPYRQIEYNKQCFACGCKYTH